jgi:ABC-2 type transport system permease protein
MQLVLGKFLAALLLVAIALLPALLYFYSVYTLGKPVGNVDVGAFWGAYAGLLMLAACYLSAGIFASSLSDSQIVAFILGAFLSFVLYLGFDGLAALPLLKNHNQMIANLGINAHYKSISRGLIDIADITYFAAVAAMFLVATRFRISR